METICNQTLPLNRSVSLCRSVSFQHEICCGMSPSMRQTGSTPQGGFPLLSSHPAGAFTQAFACLKLVGVRLLASAFGLAVLMLLVVGVKFIAEHPKTGAEL